MSINFSQTFDLSSAATEPSQPSPYCHWTPLRWSYRRRWRGAACTGWGRCWRSCPGRWGMAGTWRRSEWGRHWLSFQTLPSCLQSDEVGTEGGERLEGGQEDGLGYLLTGFILGRQFRYLTGILWLISYNSLYLTTCHLAEDITEGLTHNIKLTLGKIILLYIFLYLQKIFFCFLTSLIT